MNIHCGAAGMAALAGAAGLAAPAWAAESEACLQDATTHPSVSVRANGDDDLTQRLSDAIVAAYGACDSGYVVGQDSGGRLTVIIAGNLGRKQVGTRMRVSYKVDYAVYGQASGGHSGACWDDQLSACAAAIVKATPFVNME